MSCWYHRELVHVLRLQFSCAEAAVFMCKLIVLRSWFDELSCLSEKFLKPRMKTMKLEGPYCIFRSRSLTCVLIAAVMRSDGFKYLKDNCPSLQSELLKTIAGCEEDYSSGGKSRSVWAQLSDGTDSNGRRVRQRTWLEDHWWFKL